MGKKIRAVRRAAGLTQRELAARIGCTRQHISKLERAETCTLRTLTKIADALGVPLRDFF